MKWSLDGAISPISMSITIQNNEARSKAVSSGYTALVVPVCAR